MRLTRYRLLRGILVGYVVATVVKLLLLSENREEALQVRRYVKGTPDRETHASSDACENSFYGRIIAVYSEPSFIACEKNPLPSCVLVRIRSLC
jgi:hypothetical protein